MTPNTELSDEQAPANGLPTWEECALRVSNSDFIAKRVAEGGYGPEPDSLLASQLHRFIYEYDDMDPYRSAWFMHRLELLLNEVRAEARAAIPAASLREQREPDLAKIEADAISYAALSCLGPVKQAYRYFHAQGKTEKDFDKCAWDAMAQAVRHAVALTAREVKDPVWPYVKECAAEGDEGSGGVKGPVVGSTGADWREVAEVVSFTNGSYSRNYKVRWIRDVPEGTKLYAKSSPTSPPNGKTADVEVPRG